ncbi:TniB protein [Palleronia aestuarii]|uniref:TniB protein n=1 Tax=Palleronia aestuarii TaxID=568105 RepID=A0A2W7MXV9_9RHOB|nr:TniB family NTP-binding protein [Palleronia aestuarii]PZX12828.1 TniB protein [Palleronia aestuarii]
MTISDQDLAAFHQYGRTAAKLVSLERRFVKTDAYREFRKRVISVLEAREARLKAGKMEQKGAALIGPAGSGKSRIAEEVIAEYHALAEASGGREFGFRIVSVIVPGRATVKETLKEILRALGYPVKTSRDEDYLTQLLVHQLKMQRIAGIHLDEVQDSGRFKTSDSIEAFSKRFRNLTQDKEWPICLIMTSTLEGRAMINHDPTLTRRLRPMELKPMTYKTDGLLLRSSVEDLLIDASLDHDGLLEQNEFIKILIHASAARFGVALEIAIEAIGECLEDGSDVIDMGHFADAYSLRTDSDEELNPFVVENWSTVDTGKVLQRYEEEYRHRRRRSKHS